MLEILPAEKTGNIRVIRELLSVAAKRWSENPVDLPADQSRKADYDTNTDCDSDHVLYFVVNALARIDYYVPIC
jgi:hypothetical protein